MARRHHPRPGRDGHLHAGHQRSPAATELTAESVPAADPILRSGAEQNLDVVAEEAPVGAGITARRSVVTQVTGAALWVRPVAAGHEHVADVTGQPTGSLV